jgi:hypothetical protein
LKGLTGGGIKLKVAAKFLRLMGIGLSVNAFVLLAVGAVMLCRPVRAQSGAGSIQGTVADSTGAAIPNANIHVENAATGVTANTTSNGVGYFQVPGLFAGTYKVTVAAPSLTTYAISIELLVAQSAVINPVLVPGAITQQVTVNADTVQLTTVDNGSLASTLENQRINQLPMNGRNLTTLLANTTPGMGDDGQRMNGQSVNALEYVFNGTPSRNDLAGGMNPPIVQLVDPDSIQEVRIESTSSGAQYATPATAVVTTKSGTNRLHGSFFETARNNAFGVARSRQDAPGVAAPHLVRNEFGLSAGGPVILPRIYNGKDKTFWFFAFERYSLAKSSTSLTKVPSLAMRQGDFSGLYNGSNVLQVLYDPSTTQSNTACPVPNATKAPFTTNNKYCRTPFAGNKIPMTQISPLAKIYYQLAPTPAGPYADANPLVSGNLTALSPTLEVVPQTTFRIDHTFNEKNRAYLFYSHMYTAINTSGGPRNVGLSSPNIPVGAAFGYKNQITSTFLSSVNFTHIFSPTFFSETVYSQQWFSSNNIPGVALDQNYESMLGLPNNFGEKGFPSITGQITSLGNSQGGNSRVSQMLSTLDENLTKIVGKHQMVFGGRYRYDRDGNLPNGIPDKFAFGSNSVALYNPSSGQQYNAYANTGQAEGGLFLGSAGSYTVNLSPPHIHYHQYEFDGYFQDNYHLSKNLTFNLGLRYEGHTGLWTKDGLVNTFDLKNDAMVLGATPAQLIAKGYSTQAIITNDKNIGVKFETPAEAGMPDKLFRNYMLNFMPRVGIAYLPFGSKLGMVIRGGYGRYTYAAKLGDYANHPEQNNPLTATYTQSYSQAAQAIDGLPNELLRYNDPSVFGVAGANTANVVDTNAINSVLPGISLFSVDPSYAPTYVSETNFTIEQPLKGHSALRASYIWNHASNLDIVYNYNNHPTDYQWELATGTTTPRGGASVIGTPQQNTYSATATGPYDQTTWGQSEWHTRAGWSNFNSFQVNYQRLFHRGYAYQLTYEYTKALRAGGATGDGSNSVDPVANYPGVLGANATMTSPYGTIYPGDAPPALPAGTPAWAQYHDLIKYELYQQDSQQPTTRIRFNWLIDLPFGSKHRFFGNSNRFVNELIGGFQLAGSAGISSDLVQPTSGSQWGATSQLKTYKHKYPITDCRSGVCKKAFMWFNGYLAPTVTTGVSGSACTQNCVSGLPSDYQPVQAPVDNDPTTTNYGTNYVQLSSPALLASNNGAPVTVAYDAGPIAGNYLSKTWIHGPINWPVHASLFKVFPIGEKMNLRVNMDAFNVFNMPGENNPGTSGIESFQTSANNPREIQITVRLTF